MPGGAGTGVPRRVNRAQATQIFLITAAALFGITRLAGIAHKSQDGSQTGQRVLTNSALATNGSVSIGTSSMGQLPIQGSATIDVPLIQEPVTKIAEAYQQKRHNDSGHVTGPLHTDESEADLEDTMWVQSGIDSKHIAAEGGSNPKIALLFLTTGELPTEPVWRAFLEAAGRLWLKVKAPEITPVNLEEVLHGPMKPGIPRLDETRYPGYKIQHGLVPPSRYRQTIYPHVLRRRLLDFPLGQSVLDILNSGSTDSQRNGRNYEVINTEEEAWWTSTVKGCPGEEQQLAAEAERLLNGKEDGKQIYNAQDLFSVYVHTSPGFKFPSTSLFAGREVPETVNLTNAFALHALVAAEVRILEEALKDPRNQKLVLLSDSCVPVHPPEVVYAQLLQESKSRINACLPKDRNQLEINRWKPKMQTEHFKEEHWRKSQQWFALSRVHAELVVADRHVSEVFKRYCWSFGKHICVSDEHYIPTLLASYGLDNQTDCFGQATYADWSVQSWHPKTYWGDEISPALIQKILKQSWPPCDTFKVRRTALALFDVMPTGGGHDRSFSTKITDCMTDEGISNWEQSLHPESSHTQESQSLNDWVSQAGYLHMGYECPLFARKFAANSTALILNTTLSCSGGALGRWCPTALLSAIPDTSKRK